MRQHFSAIDKWQTKVKELKETQASEIAQCNERNASLQEQLRLKVVENENLHLALLERDEMNQKLKLEMARMKEGGCLQRQNDRNIISILSINFVINLQSMKKRPYNST